MQQKKLKSGWLYCKVVIAPYFSHKQMYSFRGAIAAPLFLQCCKPVAAKRQKTLAGLLLQTNQKGVYNLVYSTKIITILLHGRVNTSMGNSSTSTGQVPGLLISRTPIKQNRRFVLYSVNTPRIKNFKFFWDKQAFAVLLTTRQR